MSKKKWIIIIASILVFIAIGVGVGLGVGLANSNKVWYKANVTDGMGRINSYFVLVESYDELKDIECDIDEKYDEAYFTKNALVIFTYIAMPNRYKHSVKNVYKKDGILFVDIRLKDRKDIAQSSWYWKILIEVKKSDIRDVTSADYNFVKE